MLSEIRSDGLRTLLVALGIIFIVLIVFAGSLLVLKPHGERDRLQGKLSDKQQQLARAQQQEIQAREKLAWMQDFEYQEQVARDVAQRAFPEEQVIHLPQKEDEGTPPVVPRHQN